MSKKKSTPKKKCSSKCNKKNCKTKNSSQKNAKDQSLTLDAQEIVLKPKSKCGYIYNLIRKTFGYE